MHPVQRAPGTPTGFQNTGNARGSNPNTPSGKRPQDSRNQMGPNQQKK